MSDLSTKHTALRGYDDPKKKQFSDAELIAIAKRMLADPRTTDAERALCARFLREQGIDPDEGRKQEEQAEISARLSAMDRRRGIVPPRHKLQIGSGDRAAARAYLRALEARRDADLQAGFADSLSRRYESGFGQ